MGRRRKLPAHFPLAENSPSLRTPGNGKSAAERMEVAGATVRLAADGP